jgi:ribosomal protein L7/L12
LEKIILYGWKIGFNKVAHTKLLRAKLGYSLLQAKAITDSVLDRKSVAIEVAADQVEHLALQLNELGVECRVDGIRSLNQTRNEAL